jgi:prephenate dehydrogenase
MEFRRLSVIGVGLLGASIGLAVKDAGMSCRVVGYGHRKATVETARGMGAIDEAAGSLAEAVRGADLVILATPVGTFQNILSEIAPHLDPNAVVTDVGSTKRSVVEMGERLLTGRARFVGCHPMAGSEKRGPTVARADLYRGAVCIVTPTPQTDPAAMQAVERFWTALGMRITRIDPATHDRLLARVSHLPHAVAAALVRAQDPAGLPLAGKGFHDATRIAAGDAGLWRDIFLDNRDELRASLAELRKELETFESLLDPQHADALTAWLREAADRRTSL